MSRRVATVDSRASRQAAWRDVNANIAGLAGRLAEAVGDGGRDWTFLCECGEAACRELVTVTLGLYREAREHGLFVVVAGHEGEDDVVVERTPEYLVVAPR